MFTKIAIPLDGSELAEKSLPFAVSLAKALNAKLLLIRGAELPLLLNEKPVEEVRAVQVAKKYISEILSDLRTKKTLLPEQLETLVLAGGDSAKAIVEGAVAHGADLIVIATHGRSGIAKLVMGSVATGILQHNTLPVILLHSFGSASELPNFEQDLKVVVALDGTTEAEVIFEPVITLVKQLNSTIHLLRVVKPFIPVDYGALGNGYLYNPDFDIEAETERMRQEACDYLSQKAAELTQKGLTCTWEVRVGFEITQEICEGMAEKQAGLLAMATHARHKLGQIFLGSAADEVVRHSNFPIMMVHIPHRQHLAHPEQALAGINTKS